jgi:hypothetical protein
MKLVLLNFSCAAAVLAATAVFADDAELLAGKWSVKKVNDQGQNYTQTIEVKKDRFTFQIVGADNEVVIYAEGDLKLDKLGPFNAAHFTHIRGGSSPNDLQDVDDDRTVIYMLDGDTWTLASEFDKDRGQKPTADAYHRVKASAQAATLVIDEVEMAETPQGATWFFCFDATVNGTTRRHYVENKGYEKSQVTIPMSLELPKAQPGQKCTFKMQLDDVDGDVCTDEVDNRSTGDFTISDKGSQSYKPEDNWRYTIRWHLK